MSPKQIMTDKRGRQKPTTRFQRLWAEAETLAKDNAELEKGRPAVDRLDAYPDSDTDEIVKLHEQHANADSDLNADDQEALEEVLVEYLNQQRERLEDIIDQSPLHLKQIEKKREALLTVLAEVKTLKSFKEILAARYDANAMRGDWFQAPHP